MRPAGRSRPAAAPGHRHPAAAPRAPRGGGGGPAAGTPSPPGAPRRDARTVPLPILIATSEGDVEPNVVRTLGDEGFLRLPAPPSALLDRIGELLARATR